MINTDEHEILWYKGFRAFAHNSIVFVYIEDVAKLLDLNYMNGYDELGKPRIYTDWLRLHTIYHCGKTFATKTNVLDPLYPEDYIPKNKKGPKSKYAMQLPTYVHETIFLEMAKIGNYNSAGGSGVVDRFLYVQSVLDEFRKQAGIKLSHLDGDILGQQDGQDKVAHLDVPPQNGGNIMNKKKPYIRSNWENSVTGYQYEVVYKDNHVYIERTACAIQLGLIGIRTNRNNKKFIRWDQMRKFFKMAICELGLEENESGYTASHKEYQPNCGINEKEIPQYILESVIIAMANLLNNETAKQFRRDINNIIIPFFRQNASEDDIAKVKFLQGLQPIQNWKAREQIGQVPNEYNNYAYNNLVGMFEHVTVLRCWPAEYVLEDLLDALSNNNSSKRDQIHHVVDSTIAEWCRNRIRDSSVPMTYRDYFAVFSNKMHDMCNLSVMILNKYIMDAEEYRKMVNERMNKASEKYNAENKPLKTVIEFVYNKNFNDQNEQ